MELPYSTAPLNLRGREFRLVELQPSAESESIKCSLRSYSLDEDYPAYVALSYAWGRKGRYNDISLNGIQFPVGNNLWWFLHHMRLRKQYINYWIDAICINQSDISEQNHQVQMMRQIYGNAQSVSVWLGEADNSAYSDIAMKYLAARKPLEAGTFNFGKLWNARQAKGVLALCERNYWRRIWIVQEIMLAKEATIYCGSHNISWHIFERLADDLQVISDRGREKHTLCVSSILASPAFVIAKAKSAWDGNLQPLTTLLQLYSDHEATNIRDKVYALHGLAKDSSDIAVDYGMPTKELFAKVLYHACASQGSRTGTGKVTKELIRFGKMVGEMLRVHCSEGEIEFHIFTGKERAHEPAEISNYRSPKTLAQVAATVSAPPAQASGLPLYPPRPSPYIPDRVPPPQITSSQIEANTRVAPQSSFGLQPVSSVQQSDSGPVPTMAPLVIRQDQNGVQWIAFEYSRERVKIEYTIRCDVESINVDELSQEFKTMNCIYPRVCCTKDQYKGHRFSYETECNAVGWALAHLNPCLRGKRSIIQRAVNSWRNSNQDPRLRSRRVRRIAKINNGKAIQQTPYGPKHTPHQPTNPSKGAKRSS